MNNEPKDLMNAVGKLNASMDNVLAYRLGKIAKSVGQLGVPDIGDEIDRGLTLRRVLEESGFDLHYNPQPEGR